MYVHMRIAMFEQYENVSAFTLEQKKMWLLLYIFQHSRHQNDALYLHLIMMPRYPDLVIFCVDRQAN